LLELVSIIIPTYNRGNVLGETLDSVLDQTYQNWECLVIDDGSTDNTQSLLNAYIQKDSRIKYLQRPQERPKGANACRNFGFENSQGKYIQWLDSDDLLAPSKIEVQVKQLLANESLEVVFCGWISFKKYNENVGQGFEVDSFRNLSSPRELFDILGEQSTFLPPHSYLCKREIVQKTGCWNEYLSINQDGEFFSRLLLNASFIAYSDTRVFYRRNTLLDHTSVYDSEVKARDSIICFRSIQDAHLIRYKENKLPFIENRRELQFYYLFKAGYMDVLLEYEELFPEQIKRWRSEERRKKSLKRKLQRVKRFIEVKILKQ
jgi:glycosyltransferase involved in cell wall biosynthesis